MQLCSRIRVERIRLPLPYRKKNTRTTSKQKKYTTHDLKKKWKYSTTQTDVKRPTVIQRNKFCDVRP